MHIELAGLDSPAWVELRRLVVPPLLLLALGACAPRSASTASPVPATASSAGPAVLIVVGPDGAEHGFSLNQLHGLPARQITVEGMTEEGPALTDVLKAAGIGSFTSVTLIGAGSTMTLQADKVTTQVLLDFTNRGTVKLAAAAIPKMDWVKDITRIEVR